MHRRKPSQVNVPKFDKQSPAPALGLVWKRGVPKNSPLFDSHFHGETTDGPFFQYFSDQTTTCY